MSSQLLLVKYIEVDNFSDDTIIEYYFGAMPKYEDIDSIQADLDQFYADFNECLGENIFIELSQEDANLYLKNSLPWNINIIPCVIRAGSSKIKNIHFGSSSEHSVYCDGRKVKDFPNIDSALSFIKDALTKDAGCFFEIEKAKF